MVQITELTKEEKINQYMKLSKKELVELLIFNQELLKQYSAVNYFVYPLEEQACDVCGKHPNVVITTQFGTFCQEHVKYF